METIRNEHKLCLCCMEEHEVSYVRVKEVNVFKGIQVEYDAFYEYCDVADEYFSTDNLISENDVSLKNAYRKKMGLLESNQICSIRQKYGISQSDLAILLGWGEKTITRYESHQVQDAAHDVILKKLDSDPEWFLSLLKNNQTKFSNSTFKKYFETSSKLYEDTQDDYLRRTIVAKYVRYENHPDCCGNTKLDLDKVIEVICYFANSDKVKNLFKVKLMKLLWYSDALSFKRRGHSITGLVYQALPMGAVPIQSDLIIDLNGIDYEEVLINDHSAYSFTSNSRKEYTHLLDDDINVLDRIITVFGSSNKEQIVAAMHKETAYTETKLKDIIHYKYACQLSID